MAHSELASALFATFFTLGTIFYLAALFVLFFVNLPIIQNESIDQPAWDDGTTRIFTQQHGAAPRYELAVPDRESDV